MNQEIKQPQRPNVPNPDPEVDLDAGKKKKHFGDNDLNQREKIPEKEKSRPENIKRFPGKEEKLPGEKPNESR